MPKATGPLYNVPFKRRKKNLTNYKKRLALVKSGIPRLVVRKTNKRILVQLIQYDEIGDRTLVSADSNELMKMEWPSSTNVPSAYLTGLLAGKKALAKQVKEAVADIGLKIPTKSSAVFAAIKGAKDAGLNLNFDDSLVDEKRIAGEHIKNYKPEAKYSNSTVSRSAIPQLFEKVKKVIMNG